VDVGRLGSLILFARPEDAWGNGVWCSSGENCVASRIMLAPSRDRSLPQLRARTHASKATRLATAPGALPQGFPSVPPPNCRHASAPKMSTSAGMCQIWIPPLATGITPGRTPMTGQRIHRAARKSQAHAKSTKPRVRSRSPSSFRLQYPSGGDPRLTYAMTSRRLGSVFRGPSACQSRLHDAVNVKQKPVVPTEAREGRVRRETVNGARLV
jgi:hypothetical protein